MLASELVVFWVRGLHSIRFLAKVSFARLSVSDGVWGGFRLESEPQKRKVSSVHSRRTPSVPVVMTVPFAWGFVVRPPAAPLTPGLTGSGCGIHVLSAGLYGRSAGRWITFRFSPRPASPPACGW